MTCCSTACASRSRAAALPSAAEAAGVVAGVLGDRAQVLGAIALVVSEADRAFPTRLAAEAHEDPNTPNTHQEEETHAE